MMGANLAGPALVQLRAAQRELDDHLAVDAEGRCLACGQPEPCGVRQRATGMFIKYGILPRRSAGLAIMQAATVHGWGRFNMQDPDGGCDHNDR